MELNGQKSVGAVFVVGGGGKISGYTERLAEKLGLVKVTADKEVYLDAETDNKTIYFQGNEKADIEK